MASVRVEGFPSPGAETKMEAMVKGESEKILADLSEDERQEREIAFGTNQSVGKVDKMSQELVGDVQLAVEEEPSEGQEGMKVSSMKSCVLFHVNEEI